MIISDKNIRKTKTVQESIDTIWWRWTTHEGLMTFFGADNQIDLRPGGAFEIYFLTDAPAGFKGSEGCKVLSYVPKTMLSFTWNAPPQFKEIRESGYYTWVVVNFYAVSGKQTDIVLTHLGWPQDEQWDPVFDYFNQAWDAVLSWLDEVTGD